MMNLHQLVQFNVFHHVPPPGLSSLNMSAHSLQAPAQNTGQVAPGIGARVFLAIVSMIFVIGMFLVALVMSSLHDCKFAHFMGRNLHIPTRCVYDFPTSSEGRFPNIV
jgi:hypothetical protein